MRKVITLICMVLFFAASAKATVVSVVPQDFDSLLGGSAAPIGSPTIADMSVGNLKGEVISQAFTDGQDNYAYLYQVNNTGTLGNNVIEVFTCSPFFGASGSTTLGYLTANLPSGFTLGNQLAAGASVDPTSGPTVSFGFPYWLDEAVDPGESSKTLYVLSDGGTPGMITGNIIDGETGTGQIVGAVPEPATIALLGLGSLAVFRRKRL